MKAEKIPIVEIPQEFTLNNMTAYQRDLIELKYYIFNRFLILRKKKMKKIDIYHKISEEVSLQPDTVNKIYNGTVKKLIFNIRK